MADEASLYAHSPHPSLPVREERHPSLISAAAFIIARPKQEQFGQSRSFFDRRLDLTRSTAPGEEGSQILGRR